MHDFRSQAMIRTDESGLLEKLKADSYAWMRIRITETWPQWREAIKQLTIKQDMFNRKKKKVRKKNIYKRLNIEKFIIHEVPHLASDHCGKWSRATDTE